MPGCADCGAIDRHFDARRVASEMATYRRRGPTGTARLILGTVRPFGPIGNLLDIGAGIGVLHHELLDAGVENAVHVEASRAYMEAARAEACRRGHGDRVRFLHADFVELAESSGTADLVTLDRVVCCYAHLDPLLRAAAAKARRYCAVSYPHDRWYVRAHTRWQNFRRRRAGNPFRTYVHSPARIRTLLEGGGLRIVRRRRTPVWEVLLAVRV